MRYRFGEFVLDAGAYTLTRAGEELALQPKVFDVLRYLVEHCDRVVTKEELLDTLWAGEHVNEGAVPWSISHARRALGQERGDKHPIETVHGRGYRFVSQVESLPATMRPEALRTAPPPDARPPLVTQRPRALPFVGRSEVMAQLEGRLERAIAGEGGLCLLVGEAGIGKTRCMEELAERAKARGVSVWTGRTVEGLGAPVLWPWLQVVREAVRERPALQRSGEALLSRLAALESQAAPALSGEPSEASGASGRFWVLDGLSRFLLEAAAQAPVAVLVDDLHWADAGTLELLTFITPELRRSSLLVIATLRNELDEHERRRLSRLLRGAEHIELKHLSLPDVERYVAELTAAEQPVTELCRAVHRVSAGNPLFVQETVRTLLAEHVGEALTSIGPDAVQPSQLARDVLRARLRPLDESALRVLSLASVLGETFELALLQRLHAAPLEPLLSALELSARNGLVAAEGPNRYRFAHALLRSILYDDMPSRERVAAHRRAAELLSELYRAEPRHSEIAYHYHRSMPAGEYDRIAAAATRAAEAAAAVQAFEDAVSFYDWALEAQALDPQVTPRARAELLFSRGAAQRLAGSDQDARRTLLLVIESARQHGFVDLLLNAARVLRPTQAMSSLPDPVVRSALEEVLRTAPQGPAPQRISALSLLACVPPYAHDLRKSGELSSEALSLAHQLNQPRPLLEALRARLFSLSGPDDIDALLTTGTEMLERARDMPGWTVETHTALYGALVYRGDLAKAGDTLRALSQIVKAQRVPEAIWYADRLRVQVRLLEGHFDEAEAGAGELLERSKRMGLSYGPAFSNSQRTLIALLRKGPAVAKAWNVPAAFAAATVIQPSYRAGMVRLTAEVQQLDAARRMLDSMAARDFEDLPKDIGYLNALSSLAMASALLGDRARCERLYALLAPYPNHNTPNSMMFYEGSASYGLAVAAAALGWDEQAEHHFDDAIAMNRRLGMRPQLARVSASAAEFHAKRGPRAAKERCQQMVAIAVEFAEPLGMQWILERVRAL